MRAFVIADASKRKSKPVGLLLWEPDHGSGQGRFSLELPSSCDAAALPLSLSFCASRADRRATPEESEDWVRSRIVPESRHNIVEVLMANGLREYDEIGLFAACQGRSSDDDCLAYEVVLPNWLADELETAGQSTYRPGETRADRVLSAVERQRIGKEIRYAFAELPAEGPSARKSHSQPQCAAKRIGRQIRAKRLDAGLTQKQLAAQAGITQTVLSRVESGNGNPTLSLIEDIASALGADLCLSVE